MKILGTTFGNVGGPIPPQVTLRSFSAPLVPGELENDLRVTWGGMGPPHSRQDPPGPDSKRKSDCYVLLKKSIAAQGGPGAPLDSSGTMR